MSELVQEHWKSINYDIANKLTEDFSGDVRALYRAMHPGKEIPIHLDRILDAVQYGKLDMRVDPAEMYYWTDAEWEEEYDDLHVASILAKKMAPTKKRASPEESDPSIELPNLVDRIFPSGTVVKYPEGKDLPTRVIATLGSGPSRTGPGQNWPPRQTTPAQRKRINRV